MTLMSIPPPRNLTLFAPAPRNTLVTRAVHDLAAAVFGPDADAGQRRTVRLALLDLAAGDRLLPYLARAPGGGVLVGLRRPDGRAVHDAAALLGRAAATGSPDLARLVCELDDHGVRAAPGADLQRARTLGLDRAGTDPDGHAALVAVSLLAQRHDWSLSLVSGRLRDAGGTWLGRLLLGAPGQPAQLAGTPDGLDLLDAALLAATGGGGRVALPRTFRWRRPDA